MKVPFTWKVTGWFMIGWSAEFVTGTSRPLRYFGEDMVAYRDAVGQVHVMEAHCKHLGAHLGHGGKVVDDRVECPFHGWQWGPDGHNKYIPYQPERPNRALTLRVYPVAEQHGCVFLWYQPEGKEPQWELPDIFGKFPQFNDDPAAFYRPYPEFSRLAEREPVHPQIVAENAADTAHFRYVHRSSVTPVTLDYENTGVEWRFVAGWPDERSNEPGTMSLRLHSHFSGLGFAIGKFEGAQNYRLIFACTPVEDEQSNMFYSIWWPKPAGETAEAPPAELRERVERDLLSTVFDDLSIWRHQVYIENPPMARVDAKPFMALRRWAKQFYEVPGRTEPEAAS